MKLIKRTLYLLVIGVFVFAAHNISAHDYDIAQHPLPLGDTSVNVLDIENNQYVVYISSQMNSKGYNPAPNNYYYGNLIVTNDTNQSKKLSKIEVAGMVARPSSKWPLSDYEIVLNEWFTYSFNVGNGKAVIPDIAINKFTGAGLITPSQNQLVSDGGYADLGEDIYLKPGESINVYYDFSYHWKADNRTQGMGMTLLYAIDLEDVYTIETSVSNGIIDSSIENRKSGSDYTINYQANDGYELKQIIVDGKAVDITQYPTSYTFTALDANHTIEVVYSPISTSGGNDSNTSGNDNTTDNSGVSNNVDNTSNDNAEVPKGGNETLLIAICFIILASGVGVFNRYIKVTS